MVMVFVIKETNNLLPLIISDIIASVGAMMQPIDGEFLERDAVTNGGEYNHDLVDESDNEHED